ncbi:MAG: NAD-dependent epimerase/dehydratase [Pirellulales bacterium]|nr:NAD-dependent epimerase/dehydratase [Pirellulales bacterium]
MPRPSLDCSGSVSPTRWLVLGGTGFIGRQVASQLCAQGQTIWVVARNRDVLAVQPQTHLIDLDLLHGKNLPQVLGDVQADVVINCVGYGIDRGESDERTAEQINAWLPRHLVECVRSTSTQPQRPCVLVHLASEFERRQPGGVYGRTKRLGTENYVTACRQLGVCGVAVRLFTVYGPGEHAGRLLPSLLQHALDDELIKLTDGQQLRDFTFVEDVATGILRLAKSNFAPGEIVELGTGENTSVREFALQAARTLGIEPVRLQFGALPRRAEDIEGTFSPADTTRLDELTAWRPATTIVEGVTRTMLRRSPRGARPAETS